MDNFFTELCLGVCVSSQWHTLGNFYASLSSKKWWSFGGEKEPDGRTINTYCLWRVAVSACLWGKRHIYVYTPSFVFSAWDKKSPCPGIVFQCFFFFCVTKARFICNSKHKSPVGLLFVTPCFICLYEGNNINSCSLSTSTRFLKMCEHESTIFII